MDNCIPHICHGRTDDVRVNFFLAGVNFYRFNAKNWQFTVYFAVITQKIGNLLVIYAFFGVYFILEKFCPCKKNDIYMVCI